MIKQQTNIKDLVYEESFEDLSYSVEANFKALGKTFGKDTHTIATAIGELDGEATGLLVDAVLDKAAYKLALGDAVYDITAEHVVLSKHVGEGYEANETPCGSVYLVTTSTPELEAEGFAREMMRRIQTVRKELGLQKQEVVRASVEVSEKLSSALLTHEQDICERCGLSELLYGSVENPQLVDEVKGESFKIYIERV